MYRCVKSSKILLLFCEDVTGNAEIYTWNQWFNNRTLNSRQLVGVLKLTRGGSYCVK